MVLFAVACRSRVGLKNRHILDTDPAVGRPSKARVRFIVKIFRQVLGGRVDHREGLDVVDHLMIETLDDMPHDLAQILEIKEQTSFVEFGSGQRNANFVVMAVRVLALAFIVAQVVSRGKCVFNGYFEHGSPCGRIQRRPRSTPKPILYRGNWRRKPPPPQPGIAAGQRTVPGDESFRMKPRLHFTRPPSFARPDSRGTSTPSRQNRVGRRPGGFPPALNWSRSVPRDLTPFFRGI